MKFVTPQIRYLLQQRESRENIRSLLRYLAFIAATVAAYSALFHVLMIYEGQQHSWTTGLYWTLTVMSTLGFGDITFHTDLGRLFTILVLISGIILLLVVLPFAFIRLFYAPWLEAQLRLRAPREANRDVTGHVIMCRYGDITSGLIVRLDELEVPYYVIEPDPSIAATLHGDGIRVVTGALDNIKTYESLHAERAKLVVANLSDAENSNIALTVRERYKDLPIAAFAEDPGAVEVLELSGADNVLPLKNLRETANTYFKPEDAWTDVVDNHGTLWGVHNAVTRVLRPMSIAKQMEYSGATTTALVAAAA